MQLNLAEQSRVVSFSDTELARVLTPRIGPLMTRSGDMTKRITDVILGSLLIMMFSWLLLLIAVAIKVTSPGPVFFIQERRGCGKTFRCFKFRSMYHSMADAKCDKQTGRNDPRVTRIGRSLRKHSLDELPQLFNVILGDMSLVGPRPHAVGMNLNGKLLSELVDNYHHRYHVRPGITGWAQVNGCRGIVDTQKKLEDRLEYDLWYIRNWTLWLDIKILARTFFMCLDKKEKENAF